MAVERINLLKAYVNLQEKEKEIRTEVWPYLKDLSGLENVVETSGHLVSHLVASASLDSGDVLKGIDRYTRASKIFNDFRDQIKQIAELVYDAQFDSIYLKYLEDPDSKLYDEEFTISLQCTHTDADGLGSVVPMQVIDAYKYSARIANNITLVVKCPEYVSDEYIEMAIAIYKEMMGGFCTVPRKLIITDIPLSYDLYKKIKDIYKLKWSDEIDFDSDEPQAMYVDHHHTNPLKYRESWGHLIGTFVASTYGEFKKIPNVRIDEDIQIPHVVDDLKISATYMIYTLMYKKLYELLGNQALVDLFPDIVAISQWDTFEWRDHAECHNDLCEEVTPTLIGTMGFDHPVYLDVNRSIYSIWKSVTGLSSTIEIFDRAFIDELKEDVRISYKIAEKMWAGAAVVSSKQIHLDDPALNGPEYWVIVGFPTIGNFSLITHYMMQLDSYGELQTAYGTVGILAMDLMDSTLSFRTNESTVNVADVAMHLGGGGHKQASGAHNDEYATRLKAYLQEISTVRKIPSQHPDMK